MSAQRYGLPAKAQDAPDPEVPRPQAPVMTPQQQQMQQQQMQQQQMMQQAQQMQQGGQMPNMQQAMQMMQQMSPQQQQQMQQMMGGMSPQQQQQMQQIQKMSPQQQQQMMMQQQQAMQQMTPQQQQQMRQQQMQAQAQAQAKAKADAMTPEERRAQKIKYQTIYPQYIDSNYLPSEGRKLTKAQSVEGPSLDEIFLALQEMGFKGMYKDGRKGLPCAQSSAVMYPPALGCIKVSILEPRKSEDPEEEEVRIPILAAYPTRGAVLKKVAAIINEKVAKAAAASDIVTARPNPGPDRSGKGEKKKAQLEEAKAKKGAAKKGGKRK